MNRRIKVKIVFSALAFALLLVGHLSAEAGENYTEMLAQLRSEITAELPTISDADRKRIEGAIDTQARIDAIEKVPALTQLLNSNKLDAKLAKFVILHEATPTALTEFAKQGALQQKLLDTLLSDDQLMLQMVIADGARPVHGFDFNPAKYGRAMEIYSAIQAASPKAKEGIYQRLALAVALEYSEAEEEDSPTTPGQAPKFLMRYLHYEKAFDAGELDPSFERLSVWDLRFVICAPESDETLAWGREMLRNYRPDHIITDNQGWRYANVVNTDVRYGSINVDKDRPELMGPQNILMNGGICGRRAFFARFICRAFGIPATARPSTGHGASARWTPDGWGVVLGPRWGSGRTSTRYRNDLAFVATTQARVRGEEFLTVKRAYWIGDVMGETRSYSEFSDRHRPAFWNAVALATQRRIIEESEAVTLDAFGAEFGEANGTTVATELAASALKPEDREIRYREDGTITIPAAACTQANGKSNDVIPMKSFAGGLQVFLPRFLQQKPILVRGGSIRHEAELCDSATRHWRGRRPKKSRDLRGLRLAVTADSPEVPRQLSLEIADGVMMEFVYIPPGKFTMGGTREQKQGDVLADTPRHEVTLTQGYYLAKYEVTEGQYQAVMARGKGGIVEEPNLPVQGVKPYTGLRFCDEISMRTGRDVRLPTEAEWEYAARAGTDTRYFFGNDPSKLGDYAWFKENAGGKRHPVGQKKPNQWGLYDIYGNVAEFVRDEHSEDYYAQGPKVDPAGPSLGTYSSMEFNVEAPKAGDYALTARVVTSNVDQSIQVAVNSAESPTTLALPFTIGAWAESESVTVTLKQGTNTLHFWRDQAPQFGVAVKSFTLKPVGNK
jgi:formylglycine-generating enzyme required for sulfatase activity